MRSESVWPLPSESRRVRRFLYVSEGVILEAGVLLLPVRLGGAFLVDARTGSLDLQLAMLDIFTVLLILFFGPRAGVIRRVSPPTQDEPPEYRDWSEAREWRWVFAVALPVIGVLLGGASLIWSRWVIVFPRGFDLLLLGTISAGVLLYVFVSHKLEM